MDVQTLLFIMGSSLFMGYVFGKMESWGEDEEDEDGDERR